MEAAAARKPSTAKSRPIDPVQPSLELVTAAPPAAVDREPEQLMLRTLQLVRDRVEVIHAQQKILVEGLRNIERSLPQQRRALSQRTQSFDEVKATQAAAAFLRLAPDKSLNFMALIKLLYMADRIAMQRLGLPITTDRYVAMKHGPVTSALYNRMKLPEGSHPTFWSSHVQRVGLQVRLESDPDQTEGRLR